MTRKSPDRRIPGRCPISVWRKVKPRDNGDRGVILGTSVPCGEPIERDGFCGKHADDRDRLAAS